MAEIEEIKKQVSRFRGFKVSRVKDEKKGSRFRGVEGSRAKDDSRFQGAKGKERKGFKGPRVLGSKETKCKGKRY